MRPERISLAIRWAQGAAIAAMIALTAGTIAPVNAQFPGGPQGHWSKAAPFPQPEEELYGVAANGKMYVFGGFGAGKPVGMLWEYDPAADSWKALAPMPGKRGSTVAAEVGGQIYVIGGAIPEPGTKEVAIRA